MGPAACRTCWWAATRGGSAASEHRATLQQKRKWRGDTSTYQLVGAGTPASLSALQPPKGVQVTLSDTFFPTAHTFPPDQTWYQWASRTALNQHHWLGHWERSKKNWCMAIHFRDSRVVWRRGASPSSAVPGFCKAGVGDGAPRSLWDCPPPLVDSSQATQSWWGLAVCHTRGQLLSRSSLTLPGKYCYDSQIQIMRLWLTKEDFPA